MPAPRSVAPAPNLAPLLAGAAGVAGAAATWFRLPGAVAALILLVAAAWMSTPPPLTGRKDAAGYPTVGNPGEERALLRHRMWSSLKWRLMFPSTDWLLNDTATLKRDRDRAQQEGASVLSQTVGFVRWLLVPSTFVTYIAVGAALVVFTFPVDGFDVWGVLPGAGAWLMWPNAAAAFIIVKQVDAARRRFAAPEDPKPAVTVAALKDACERRGRPLFAVLAAAAGIIAVTVTVVLVAVYALDVAWLITPPVCAAVGFGLVAGAGFARAQSLPEAAEAWENTVAARAEWEVRWQTLKVDPAPYLIQHTRLNVPDQLPVVADTFEAPATLGAVGAIGLLAKLTPAIGAGVKVTILNEPDIDSQGQPIPGSKHPLRFTVVAWPVDTKIDVTDPAADLELVRMAVRAGAAAGAAGIGYPQPVLVDLQPVFTTDPPADAELDDDGEPRDEPVTAAGVTAAYATIWDAPDVAAGDLMPAIAGAVAGALGAEAIADAAAGGVLYIGALTSGTTVFNDESLTERFDILIREMAWAERWRNVLKLGEQQPYIQSAVYKRASLATGQLIESQPFMTPQGIFSESYITAEKERKLQSTLDNAPFVAIAGWEARGARPGERHPGAFRVMWSMKPVPSNPGQIAPAPGSTGTEATKWALAAAVNAGFDAAKLPRPELVTAQPLTDRKARAHIWDLTLRLYGGVTLMAVKLAAEKIRQGMGAAEWLRITGDAEGCRIIVGASPHSDLVQFSRARNRDVTTALDWEQAFADSRIVGTNGQSPQLLSATPLPKNEKVQQLEFRMPPGVSRGQIRDAKSKLAPATGNVYMDDQPGAEPDVVRLIVCPEEPLPFPAPFDWAEMDGSNAIPFASNVEGEPVQFDWREDPHLLVLGGTGSGKSAFLSNIIAGALIRQCDVYVADPTKFAADFRFAAPWVRAMAISELEASAMMDAVYDEVKRRRALNGQYGVASYVDLPDEVRPPHLVVLIDEFTSLITTDRIKPLPDTASEDEHLAHAEATRVNDARRNIGAKSGRLVREARSAGVTLVLAGQELKAETLAQIPGGGSLKNNMSSVLLGRTSFGSRMSALKNPMDAPELGDVVPKGRGIFESSAARATVIQAWYDAPDHNGSLVEHIAAVREPLANDERVDLAAMVPAMDDTPVFGRRIDDGDGAPVVVAEVEEIDLGVAEDIDFGDFDFAADDDEPAAEVAAPVEDAAGSSEDTAPEGAVEHRAAAVVTTVTFEGPGFSSDLPGAIDVDELAPGAPVTGSPAVDAIAAWVTAHPDVTAVTWVSPLTGELDEIGITHGELASSVLAGLGVTTVTCTTPDGDAPAVPAVPTPSTVNPMLELTDTDDLFDSPAHTPVSISDDLFD